MTEAAATRAWLQLIRAPAVPTAVSNIVAAHLVATAGRIDWLVLTALSLASCCLYAGGMILNDCFDREVDARDRPDRPLPSGAADPALAWRVGAALLIAGVLLAAAAGTAAAGIACVLALLILAYDGLMKHTWIGPVNMGLCRYLNWLLGLSVMPLTVAHARIGLPVFCYVLSLTLVSRVEARAESRTPVAIALVAMLVAALVYAQWLGQGPVDLLPALAFFGLALVRIGGALRDFTPNALQGTVGWLLFGIIPLDALLVLSTGQWFGAAAVLLLMLPGWLLGRGMYVT